MAVLQSASMLALVLVRRTGPLGGVVFFHTVIFVSAHKENMICCKKGMRTGRALRIALIQFIVK